MSTPAIEQLVTMFSKLPGLGSRSARRVVLDLLTRNRKLLEPMSREMQRLSETIVTCQQCGNIDVISPCHICGDNRRDPHTICIVEEVADLWAFERGAFFRGSYHVLGGTLSAMDGKGPEELGIERLIKRIQGRGDIQEVIIATNATVEGQTTAHYIAKRLEALPSLRITRLAHGIPVGGELDYMDEGTLTAALSARQSM